MKDFLIYLQKYMIENDEINSKVDNRIYPLILPQDAVLPAIVYTPLKANYGKALQKHTGFVKQIIQFTLHDKTFGKVRNLSGIIKSIFEDFSGDMNGFTVQATHLINDIVSKLGTTSNYDTEEYMAVLEFEFNFMEQE